MTDHGNSNIISAGHVSRKLSGLWLDVGGISHTP